MEAVGNILLYRFRRLPRKPRLPKTSKYELQPRRKDNSISSTNLS
jgi:hypothetical protein